MTEKVCLLHVPRTGGSARRYALNESPNVLLPPHEFRLSRVRPDTLPAIFLRDPVERFLSAYDYLRQHGTSGFVRNPGQPARGRDLLNLYQTAEDLALNLGDAWDAMQRQTIVFRPAVWWLDVARHDLFVGRTERMEADMQRLCKATGTTMKPLERRNGVERTSTLSKGARAIVRERYGEDYEWWLG